MANKKTDLDNPGNRISVSLNQVDVNSVRDKLLQKPKGLGAMGAFAGPAVAYAPGMMGQKTPTGGGGGGRAGFPSVDLVDNNDSSASGGGGRAGFPSVDLVDSSYSSSSSESAEIPENCPTPVSSLSIKPVLNSELEFAEEELESESFLIKQDEALLSLSVYIVQVQLKKKIRMPAAITAREACDRIATSAHVKPDPSLHLYYAKTAIFLKPNRKLWSYLLKDGDQLELKPVAASLRIRRVVVVQQIPGRDEIDEELTYLPQTSAFGIMQQLSRKICDRIPNYGIYVGTKCTLLPNQQTLSSCRLEDGEAVICKPVSNEEKQRHIILKILLVETSGSKMMRFDINSRVIDANRRLAKVTKCCDIDQVTDFGLFIPLGAPLDEDATLQELNLKDRDVLEFKKKPPHILQQKRKARKSVIMPLDKNMIMQGNVVEPAIVKVMPQVEEEQEEYYDEEYEEEDASAKHVMIQENPVEEEEVVVPVVETKEKEEEVEIQEEEVQQQEVPVQPVIVEEVQQPIKEEPKVLGHISKWSIDDVYNWLVDMKLPDVAEIFKENLISGIELVELEADELKEDLGITALGKRKKIIKEVQSLKEKPIVAAVASPSAKRRAAPQRSPSISKRAIPERKSSLIKEPLRRSPPTSTASSSPNLTRRALPPKRGSNGSIGGNAGSSSPRGRVRGRGARGARGTRARGRGRGARGRGGTTANAKPCVREKLQSTPKLSESDSFEIVEESPTVLKTGVIEKIINNLIARSAWEVEGIFRISGTKDIVEQVWKSLQNASPYFDVGIHNVSGTLKQYLRNMTPPLIPDELYSIFLEAAEEEDYEALYNALTKLPRENKKALELCCKFCVKVAEHSEANKMSAHNLGIVFGPNILRKKGTETDLNASTTASNLYCMLIEGFTDLFPGVSLL